jgi:hypothetical protein
MKWETRYLHEMILNLYLVWRVDKHAVKKNATRTQGVSKFSKGKQLVDKLHKDMQVFCTE